MSSRLVAKPMEGVGAYWHNLHVQLMSTNSFEELLQCVHSCAATLPRIDLNITNVRLTTDYRDPQSMNIIPWDILVRNPFPIDTFGDGRCFLFAAARLLWGYADQMRVEELRVRLVIEGVLNREWYLKHENLAIGLRKEDPLSMSVPDTYALMSGAYDDNNQLDDVPVIYNNMVFKYREKFEVRIVPDERVTLLCCWTNFYYGFFCRKRDSGSSTCLQTLRVLSSFPSIPGSELMHVELKVLLR